MSKNSVYMSKEVKAAVAKAMSKAQRKWWKDGELFNVRIYRIGHGLKRWGNMASFTCNGKGKVTRCNLEEFGETSFEGAIRALDYFVYGDKTDYTVVIM